MSLRIVKFLRRLSRWAVCFVLLTNLGGPVELGRAAAPAAKGAGSAADKGTDKGADKSADKETGRSPADRAAEKANAALNAPSAETAEPGAGDQGKTAKQTEASLLEFYHKGGVLMYPITFFSFIAIAFTIERMIALRRNKIVPNALVEKLGDLATSPGGFDPRKAYKLCQQYPSSTANVIRAMLLKVGRPNVEVEQTVKEVCDREASRLYQNIRPISLSFIVAPMLGLLGTTLGMIVLFHAAAVAQPGMDKAAFLSDGIYTKLLTTFAGLCVAIPSVIAAQLLEGKIIWMFHDIADLAQSLVPQIERYEGKLRVSQKQLSGDGEGAGNGAVPAVAKV
ncbi:MAG TPA: MotA/TolQ/ExbB proton channel family protein [Pirellulales bacterium]|nr:MotA/TolQ/ExbB proton channel family protein [Pirellulales bacterium]